MDLEGNRELALEIYETSINGDIEKENGDSIVATEKLLREIRSNCVYLSIYHNRRYHFYKNILFTIFRVPLIILGGFNSFTAVGLQNYIEQRTISLINAMLSLFSAIVTSIELLLNLQKRMENELDSYKKYYKLSIEIYTYIELEPQNRDKSARVFLKEIHKEYDALITAGNAINVYRRGFDDQLELLNNKSAIPEHKNLTCIGYLTNGCI
jgi:hypothetical protein